MRLFAAVDLGDAVRARMASAIAHARSSAPEARWISADGGAEASVHLTLWFFGEVDEARVAELESALAPVAAGARPFRLAVRGSGTFGSPRHPRVLWLGLEGEVEPLATMQAEVAKAVERIGFPADPRPFSPHVTLARTKAPRGEPNLARAAELLRATDCGEAEISELTLYRSELSGRGARHSALRHFRLGPPPT